MNDLADEARWIEWYESLEKPLFNVVYRWLFDVAESQDVVQDAFLRCWQIRHRIKPDGFKALIFRTALRLASNRARRRRLWRFVGLADAEPGPQPAPGADPWLDARLERALNRLPETGRRVLLLCELGGLSYEEIGAIVGVAVGTVGSRRTRALAALRGYLNDLGIDRYEA